MTEESANRLRALRSVESRIEDGARRHVKELAEMRAVRALIERGSFYVLLELSRVSVGKSSAPHLPNLLPCTGPSFCGARARDRAGAAAVADCQLGAASECGRAARARGDEVGAQLRTASTVALRGAGGTRPWLRIVHT